MRTAKALIRAHKPFCWFCHEAAHILAMKERDQ